MPRQIYNTHARPIEASAATVGALIDTLASREDQLWPGRGWPRLRLDRGLVVGSTGGHGPIGYRVAGHEPGRSVTFEFTGRPAGLYGTHGFVVIGDDQRCVLWHLVQIRPTGATRLLWRPLWGPLHDALIEDALARADFVATGSDERPAWSRWVRVLRYAMTLRSGRPAAYRLT